MYLQDTFASGAVGACVAAGVEVSYVLIVPHGPEWGLWQVLADLRGKGALGPRSAASAWRPLCRRAALPAVSLSRTELLMLSPNLMRHHVTRSDERRRSRRLTAGLVKRGKRAGAA